MSRHVLGRAHPVVDPLDEVLRPPLLDGGTPPEGRSGDPAGPAPWVSSTPRRGSRRSMPARPGDVSGNHDLGGLGWCRSSNAVDRQLERDLSLARVSVADPRSRHAILARSFPPNPEARVATRAAGLAHPGRRGRPASRPLRPTAGFASPTDPADREASSEEDDAKEGAIPDASNLTQKRTRPLRGSGIGRAPSRVPHRPAAGRVQVRLARHRRGGGHFLGEARHLRRWIQSFLF